MAEESGTPSTEESAAKSSAKKAITKKTSAKKTSAKKTATKKTPATKKSATKKTAAKKTAKPASAAVKTARTTATTTAAGTTSSASGTGRALVAKATSATRRPVAAGKALVDIAGERVADLGRAVRSPSSKFLARAQVRAKEMMVDPVALRRLAEQTVRSQSGRSGPFGEVIEDFATLGRLVAAWSRGDYRDIPLDSLLLVIAGLVYVVSPLDLIPEAVPVAGYVDDAVAIGFVIRQVHHELAAFREWEAQGPSTS
jgi:uncharacterized membrane protein YkvA (DUF1232 family)